MIIMPKAKKADERRAKAVKAMIADTVPRSISVSSGSHSPRFLRLLPRRRPLWGPRLRPPLGFEKLFPIVSEFISLSPAARNDSFPKTRLPRSKI
jgi:hypothetical protein